MTEKHRVTLVWTTVYSFSWQSEKSCLELGAHGGKKSLMTHLLWDAGTMGYDSGEVRLRYGAAEGKWDAFATTWAAPSLKAEWLLLLQKYNVSVIRTKRTTLRKVNDIGQHRSTSLSLSTPATHLNWCLTGSPNCPLRNLQNTWKYYRSLKQAMKELSIQGITHPLNKWKMDPGCGWVTHHFWPFPSSVPKSLQRWLPRCWRWE